MACVLALATLAACGPGIHTREKVQQAIVERLQTHSGLDVNGLDITTTSVSFQKNMAYATVSIHPKADPSLQSMVMKYTLEDRDGKWVVVNVADSQGHGMPGQPSASGQALPPGHPAVSNQALPPGHPAVGDTQGGISTPEGTGTKQ